MLVGNELKGREIKSFLELILLLMFLNSINLSSHIFSIPSLAFWYGDFTTLGSVSTLSMIGSAITISQPPGGLKNKR